MCCLFVSLSLYCSSSDDLDTYTLEDALEMERKRNALLSSKLKKAKAKNKELMNSNIIESNPRLSRFQSTFRDDTRQNGAESLSTSMNNLSFASLNIAECKPVDGEDEIDRRSFESWRELLEASMQLVGVTDEITKMSIFRIKAGPKLLEVLENTGSSSRTPSYGTTPYSNAMSRLMDFFGSRDYTLLHRQKLRSLTQGIAESDVKYTKRVINQAKLCDYDELQMLENVADVIQSHALNFRIREIGRKMMRKGGSISALLEKVQAIEIAKVNEEMFAKSHSTQQVQVAAVSATFSKQFNPVNATNQQPEYDYHYQSQRPERNQPRYNNQQVVAPRGGFHRGSSVQVRQTPCWRCMGRYHTASSCSAIDKICRTCHRKGHLARACNQSRGPQKRKVPIEEISKSTGPAAKKIALLSKEELPEELDVSLNE